MLKLQSHKIRLNTWAAHHTLLHCFPTTLPTLVKQALLWPHQKNEKKKKRIISQPQTFLTLKHECGCQINLARRLVLCDSLLYFVVMPLTWGRDYCPSATNLLLVTCPSVERETSYLDPWLINQDRRNAPGIISTTKQTTVPNSFISKGRESKLKLRDYLLNSCKILINYFA